ncbi:hypothetical protein LTS15_004232 [Exophiala xenobiotica]|nr:hypothetical protein LTS15_004232 [Exophiala xenobiotica]
MLQAFKMRLYGGLFLLASTIFMGLFMLLMCIVISTKWFLPSVQIPLVDSWRFYKFAMHKSMEQSHIFIPASHPHIRFIGRWTSTANQLRQDAAFPGQFFDFVLAMKLTHVLGSYLELTVTGTTSMLLSLNNVKPVPKTAADSAENQETGHSNLRPVGSQAKPSDQVSLMFELNGEKIMTVVSARGIGSVADDLDPRKKYKLRVTHMRGPNSTEGVLEFDGIWVDKPIVEDGESSEQDESSSPTHNTTGGVLLDPALVDEDDKPQTRRDKTGAAEKKRTIEILTSETPICPISRDETGATIEARTGVWYNQLRASHAVDIVTIPTMDLSMLPSNEPAITIPDLFFKSGPPGTDHFLRPWSFKSYSPSVLVLQLGLTDFMTFLSEKKNRNDHAREQFINDFVTAYVKFIRTIRRTAYPFDSSALTSNARIDFNHDDTYIHNSAPSTLPIFLISPFSASRRFITKKTRMDRVINDALQRVVDVLQADGDKSTFWIDTTGWLNHKDDFDVHGGDCPLNQGNRPHRLLKRSSGRKVASLLWDHICPYIQRNKRDDGSKAKECPFERYDNYLGNVYLPQDVEVDRAVLERKIATIKERFKIEGPGLDLQSAEAA